VIRQMTTDLDDADDEVLCAAAVLGDREAFEVIVHRHGRALYRYSRRMLNTENDCADVMQETFIAAWRQLGSGSFRHASSLRTWLFAICSHKIIDSRRIKRAQPIDDRLIEATPNDQHVDPFAAASNSAFLAALEEALTELPFRQRAAWVMREIELLTFVQIGQALQLSADAARGHHHRATATLRVRLRRWQ